MPHPQSVRDLCPQGVHMLVSVVRAVLPYDNTHLEQRCTGSFRSRVASSTLLVLTHTDYLKKAGLHPSVYRTHTTDSLRALAKEVGGRVFFMDNSSDWPAIRRHPLRDKLLLRLSALNRHAA
ncbi:hypothetical protein LDENG_00257380 [Lucifuga dentata]|nr:hypothetical protein LDENG_00257380 [Lucifuga dentata]